MFQVLSVLLCIDMIYMLGQPFLLSQVIDECPLCQSCEPWSAQSPAWLPPSAETSETTAAAETVSGAWRAGGCKILARAEFNLYISDWSVREDGVIKD